MSEEVEWKLRELSQILGTQWQDLGGYGRPSRLDALESRIDRIGSLLGERIDGLEAALGEVADPDFIPQIEEAFASAARASRLAHRKVKLLGGSLSLLAEVIHELGMGDDASILVDAVSKVARGDSDPGESVTEARKMLYAMGVAPPSAAWDEMRRVVEQGTSADVLVWLLGAVASTMAGLDQLTAKFAPGDDSVSLDTLEETAEPLMMGALKPSDSPVTLSPGYLELAPIAWDGLAWWVLAPSSARAGAPGEWARSKSVWCIRLSDGYGVQIPRSAVAVPEGEDPAEFLAGVLGAHAVGWSQPREGMSAVVGALVGAPQYMGDALGSYLLKTSAASYVVDGVDCGSLVSFDGGVASWPASSKVLFIKSEAGTMMAILLSAPGPSGASTAGSPSLAA